MSVLQNISTSTKTFVAFRVQALSPSSSLGIQAIFLVGMFCGAWASVLGRFAQHEHVSSVYIVAFRQALAVLILTPFVFVQYRQQLRLVGRRELLFTAGAGLWLAVHLIAGFSALEHTTVLVSNMLAATGPLWVALLEVSFLKTRLGQKAWIGLSLTLAGSVLLALASNGSKGLGDNPALGMMLALAGALTGALYSLTGRQSRNQLPLMVYMWLMFCFAGVVSLGGVLISGVPLGGYSADAYFYLIVLTISAQLIAHLCFNYVLRRLSATYTTIVSQLGTLLSIGLAFMFFHEQLNLLQLPAGAAILAGIVLVNLTQSRTAN